MRPTYLEVNLNALKQNLDAIRARVAPAKVMVILKANAYGHGVDGVAPFIAPFADYIGVVLVEEGIHLREIGIRAPILVMGGTLPEQLADFFEHELTLTISSPDLLGAAQRMAESTRRRLRVHLKIDTGMERIGVHEYEAEDFIKQSIDCRDLDVEGIFTHFANSELRGAARVGIVPASLQLERFEQVLSVYSKHGYARPPLVHAANSGAVLTLPQSYYDMVRPGILFYGVHPARDLHDVLDVQPALTWRSRVVHSKVTRPGRGVSYGSLWQADGPARIVTIPCGYGDGYFRRMTNQARVIIHQKQYAQVGRICMDQFMVNTADDEIEVGDEVVLLGEGIRAEDLAEWSGTNEYEVLTNISARVPRVYRNE